MKKSVIILIVYSLSICHAKGKVPSNNTEIIKAIENSNVKELKHLLESTELNSKSFNNKILRMSLQYKKFNAFELLLQQPEIKLEFQKKLHKSLFLKTTKDGLYEQTKLLLEAGLSTRIKASNHKINGIKVNPIMYSICYKNASEKMLDSFIDYLNEDINYGAPLVEAIRCKAFGTEIKNQVMVIRKLNENQYFNANQVSDHNISSLMVAASTSSDLLREVISHPSVEENFVNLELLQTKEGLDHSYLNGGVKYSRPEARVGSKATALGYAVYGPNAIDSVRRLIIEGAKSTYGEGLLNPWVAAIVLKKYDVLKEVISSRINNGKDLNFEIPFVTKGFEEHILKEDKGKQFLGKKKIYLTPLMVAVLLMDVEAIKILINNGSALDYKLTNLPISAKDLYLSITNLGFITLRKWNDRSLVDYQKLDIIKKQIEKMLDLKGFDTKQKNISEIIGVNKTSAEYNLLSVRLWGYTTEASISSIYNPFKGLKVTNRKHKNLKDEVTVFMDEIRFY